MIAFKRATKEAGVAFLKGLDPALIRSINFAETGGPTVDEDGDPVPRMATFEVTFEVAEEYQGAGPSTATKHETSSYR